MLNRDGPSQRPRGRAPAAWVAAFRGARRGRADRRAVADPPRSRAAVVSIAIYAVCLVGLYAISAGYHLIRWSVAARAGACASSTTP